MPKNPQFRGGGGQAPPGPPPRRAAVGRENIDLMESMRHVQAGGLPIRAQLRLADEARHHLFTSDLTVSEFLLAKDAKCFPLSQVMGSSIFHVGKISDYKGATGEIETISQAHRDSRRLALSRCFQEAQAIGADAVIGMRIQERLITMGQHGKGGDDGDEVIEFTVFGTAVRAPWITHVPGSPVVTDLSGQDLWALAQDGFEPCGFLFEFCRYHVWHVMKNGISSSGEVTAAHDAIETARHMVAEKLLKQAAWYKCEFVVGSDVKLSVREVPCGFKGCDLNDLDVDVSWFGTGVRRIPDFKPHAQAKVPPLILSMVPLGRKRREIVEGDDDSERLEEQAREAEAEAANESDEDDE
jgi:uncharacterized protein YbjQ (UPF0145 family)